MKYITALIAAFAVGEARYKSGAVTGFEKFTYGKFIARIKAPNKKGTVSSFFTYWNGPNFYPGGWNELDVEIVPSVEANPFSMNIIYGDGHSKRESHDYDRGFDPKDEWHIYEMAWTPDYIAWSLDGKEVRRVTGEDPAVKYMTKGQSVMMNFWTPTFDSWGKGFDDKDMPWYVNYDYVETYTYNTETKGFDFHWKDDFDTFDSNRWHKSDNTTFDANSTTFRATQSYVLNGNLVLKMEPDLHSELHGDIWAPTHVLPVMTQPTYEAHGELHKGDGHDYLHHGYGVPPHSFPYDDEQAHHFHGQAPYPHGYGEMGGYPGYYGGYGGYGGLPGYGGYYGNPWDHSGYGPYSYRDAYSHHVDLLEQHEHSQPKDKKPAQPKGPAKPEGKKNAEYFGGYHDVHGLHGGHHYANDPFGAEMNTAPYHHPVSAHHADDMGAWDIPHHDLTPYEHHAHEDPHHAVPMHGDDSHSFAHFDAGYWDLKGHEPHLGDHGHFAGEDHGDYHYLDRGVDGHHGTYYSYYDQLEHHPSHAMDYHDTHGIEHHPDDWLTDVHHPVVYGDYHHDFHDSHHDTPHHDQFYLGDHHDSHHDEDLHHDIPSHIVHPYDDYNHDSDFHHGTQMVHDIETSYDQLFHDIETHTLHGVEHHEHEYTHPHSTHEYHPHGHEYHYDAPHDYHHDGDHDLHHALPYAHHGDYHHDTVHHDTHSVHSDHDVHHVAPAPEKAPEKKPEEKKPEEKKPEVPVSKNLVWHPPRGDHYALHHNGGTTAFMQ